MATRGETTKRNAASSPEISRRAMLTVSTALGLGGLCAGYVRFTRPLLQPEDENFGAKAVSQRDPAAPQDPQATQFLPEESWAASADYKVHNGRLLVYFNTWQVVEHDTAVKLEPFAMIVPPKKGETAKRPLTVAGRSAILRVEGTIDLTHPKPGRIVGGTVSQEVHLRGPDDLEVRGSNFTFDEDARRVWSDEDVTFRQGGNHGRGHGMQLELFRVQPAAQYETLAVNGVTMLRLLSDVDMTLVSDSESSSPLAILPRDDEASDSGPPPPTTIHSDGAFTFDMRRNVARFQENVVARRGLSGPSPGTPSASKLTSSKTSETSDEPDRMECDRLRVEFEPGTPAAKQAAARRRAKIAAGTLTREDGFQGVDKNLKPTLLVATGGKQPATLHSPANDLVARFGTLTHTVSSGKTLLEADHAVIVEQKRSTLTCPLLRIERAPDGRSPTLICEGRGNLDSRDENGAKKLAVYWRDRLTRTAQPNGQDLIEVVGRAQVDQPLEDQPDEVSTLAGETINLWLLPPENQGEAKRPTATRLVDQGQVRPHKLVAHQKVMLRSPELRADTNLLQVDFLPPQTETLPGPQSHAKLGKTKPSRDRLIPTSRHTETAPSDKGTASDPASSSAVPSSDNTNAAPRQEDPGKADIGLPPAPPPGMPQDHSKKTAAPPAPPQQAPLPLQMLAEQIHVEMIRQTTGQTPSTNDGAAPTSSDPRVRESRIRRVEAVGRLAVYQERRGAPGLKISGHRLQLLNRGPNRELVHIFGHYGSVNESGRKTPPKPALIHDDQTDMWGMNIHLDRAANTAWINGEGILLLPAQQQTSLMAVGGGAAAPESSDAATADVATDKNATDKEEPDARLQIRWTERMNFDGQLATFLGHVKASLDGDQLACQQMDVTLLAAIDFASFGGDAGGSSDERPEISTIFCRDRVIVNGAQYQQERLIGRRHAEFSDLRINHQTGAVAASGPGLVKLWSLGDPNTSPTQAAGLTSANSSIPPAQRQWQYTHVQFSGRLEGNFQRQVTTFHDQVRAIYGPVSSHTQQIDPLRIELAPPGSGWMACEHLTLIRHDATGSQAVYSEALAKGDVRLRGRDFQAVADQVTFDESKGQYVIKSFGDHLATIRRAGRDRQTGQQFTFYPEQHKLNISNARAGQAFPQ